MEKKRKTTPGENGIRDIGDPFATKNAVVRTRAFPAFEAGRGAIVKGYNGEPSGAGETI